MFSSQILSWTLSLSFRCCRLRQFLLWEFCNRILKTFFPAILVLWNIFNPFFGAVMSKYWRWFNDKMWRWILLTTFKWFFLQLLTKTEIFFKLVDRFAHRICWRAGYSGGDASWSQLWNCETDEFVLVKRTCSVIALKVWIFRITFYQYFKRFVENPLVIFVIVFSLFFVIFLFFKKFFKRFLKVSSIQSKISESTINFEQAVSESVWKF